VHPHTNIPGGQDRSTPTFMNDRS